MSGLRPHRHQERLGAYDVQDACQIVGQHVRASSVSVPTSIAMVATVGTSWCSMPSRLAPRSPDTKLTPVTLSRSIAGLFVPPVGKETQSFADEKAADTGKGL
jgi:hypothetical protein